MYWQCNEDVNPVLPIAPFDTYDTYTSPKNALNVKNALNLTWLYENAVNLDRGVRKMMSARNLLPKMTQY